jgi:tRNA modification GTPase
LLNRFVGEEVAIVSEMPGTTRDTLREHLVIGGLPIHLTDTAGLRASSDPVEVLGISRAKDAMGKADLVLAVLDASEETEEDERMLASIPADVGRLLVRNKIDRIGVASRLDACSFGPQVWVSALSGEGLELLKAEILRQAGFHPGAEGVFVARERHLDALRRAQAHLRSASELKGQLELFAEELRLAQEALSEITGRMSADDLLGEIFSRFCIGK